MISIVLAGLVAAAPSATSWPAPADRIAAARSRITVSSTLGGPGAALLIRTAQNARYVMLGEDHGTREIARLADAMDATLQPFGYDTIAVETGPLATEQLQHFVTERNGANDLAAFERRFPGTTAFYTWQDEFTFLQHAAERSGSHFALWGLDQELMGAPGFILNSILETHPGPNSSALVQSMLLENERDWKKAAQTGAPPDTYLLQANESTFSRLVASLKHDGNARAVAMAQSLLDTYRIYVDCCNENARTSNRNRAILMKQTYVSYVRAQGDENRHIFFKFGEEHLYRGINPIGNNDLGNFMTETADALGTTDLHVLALGISGKQTVFAGIGKPWIDRTYSLMDDGHDRFHFLKPFIDAAYPAGYTLYDLRPFRSHFTAMGIADIGFRQLVYGYDFLVLIQSTTPDPGITPDIF